MIDPSLDESAEEMRSKIFDTNGNKLKKYLEVQELNDDDEKLLAI